MVICNQRVSQLESRRAISNLPKHHSRIKKTAIVIGTVFVVCSMIISCKSERVKNPILSEKEIERLVDSLERPAMGGIYPLEEKRVSEATRKLIAIGNEAIPILIRRLEEAKTWGTESSIPYILKAIGDRRAYPVLIKTAAKGNLSSIQVLGELRIASAVPVLIATLEKIEPDINNYAARCRESAAEALGLIGSRDAVAPLIHRVKVDEDLSVQTAAITALGLIGDKRAVPCIEDKLNSIYLFVREPSARALYLITGKCYRYGNKMWQIENGMPKITEADVITFVPSFWDKLEREIILTAQVDMTPVDEYYRFLLRLDTLDILSIPMAKDKIPDLINASSEPIVVDSIFRIFMNYYQKMIRINDHHFYGNKDYQKVLHEIWFANDSALDNPLPAFKKLKTKLAMSIRQQYGQVLIELDRYMDCGVNFDFGEGDWYLGEKSEFLEELAELFRGYRDIDDYLCFKAGELRERLGEDAGLLISWDELRKRIIRWEKFCNEHPELPETETELKSQLLTLVYCYILGTDNTLAYDYSMGICKDELVNSYQRFIKENKDSKYYSLIDSTLKILKKHNYKINREVITFWQNRGYDDRALRRRIEKFLEQ